MPIRFRCQHCNQLMGIARRKAGMTVTCPTCRAQLVVPQAAAEAAAEAEAKPGVPASPAPPTGPGPAPLFERSDFEDFLQNPVNESPPPRVDAPVPPSPPFAVEIPPAPPLSLPPSTLRPQPAGLVLSPAQATWLTVVAILLLALAFGAGLLVGHYWVG
jgi:phage FluMu protein Com